MPDSEPANAMRACARAEKPEMIIDGFCISMHRLGPCLSLSCFKKNEISLGTDVHNGI